MALDLRSLVRSDEATKRTFTRDLDELFKAAQEDRRAYEPQWLTNLAFFHGRQTLEWDETLGKMRDIKDDLPWWRPAMVVNLIKPSIITQYAKILAHKPAANVEPEAGTPQAEQAARFCDRYLEWQWPRMRKDELKKRAVLWSTIAATGLAKVYWDPHKGETVSDPATGGPRMLQDGRPLRMGEVCAIPVSPFEFYPEPTAESIADMQHCFHVKLRSKAYVREKYGVEMEEESLKSDELTGAAVSDMLDPRSGPKAKGIVVKEFWERPSAAYPEGRYVVYAGDRLLGAGPNPYPKLPLPFVAMTFYPVVGRFWGACTVDDLIDLQRNYNKARSQAVEIRNLMAKPQWLIPDGSLDEGYEITSAPGQQITYQVVDGKAPEMVQGKEVPATYFQDLQATRQEVYEVSGQHEVSRSQVPGGTKSGVAIALLQEQDDTRLGPTISSFEDFIREMEEATLVLTKQYYQEPRLISVAGKDGAVEVMHFEAASIPEDVRVRVQAGSALPRSRAARQEYVRGLWRDGLIRDPRVALRLLEFGELEGVYEDVNADIRQAERENRHMKGDAQKGEAPQAVVVEDFHNHHLHIAEHNKYRKTEEYETADQSVKDLFAQHVAEHQAFALLMPPAPEEVVPGVGQPQPQEPDVPGLLAEEQDALSTF